MQETTTALSTDEEEFKAYKRNRRLEEAKARVAKIECDCLSPLTDRNFIKETCRVANSLELGAVVVFPDFAKSCVAYLGKDPKVSLVAAVAYPYGEETTDVKVAAVKRAVKDGVDEVEVNAPLAFLRDGNWSYFKKECKKLKKACKARALRITFDTRHLSDKELLKAVTVAADAGVNCVRLNFADGELVQKAKIALKGRCLIKGDSAESAASFNNLLVMGADTASCSSACNMSNFLLRQAEKEI